jgi:hypothetical protein
LFHRKRHRRGGRSRGMCGFTGNDTGEVAEVENRRKRDERGGRGHGACYFVGNKVALAVEQAV